MSRITLALKRWFDSEAQGDTKDGPGRVDWARVLPFAFMHLACLGVFWVGTSAVAVGTAIFLYIARMFFITGFYHRYFSHKTFRTSRVMQFIFAVLGATAVQRGALWWAAHHRYHHKYADTSEDLHSPKLQGFWWSHIGWILSGKNFATNMKLIPDLARYPELVFLNRYDGLVPLLMALSLYAFGAVLESAAPALGTSGPQMLVWGFFVSTVVLFHVTSTINSLSHLIGRRRFETPDMSKNNLTLALLTFGEGWHNNHHFYQSSTRQGFYWWEIDITYYVLKSFSWLGLIRDLHPVPAMVYERAGGSGRRPG